ncbi:unnamed protein product [Spodoptera exigua]|nr:unnamed protein product [Spodoptera exigua]
MIHSSPTTTSTVSAKKLRHKKTKLQEASQASARSARPESYHGLTEYRRETTHGVVFRRVSEVTGGSIPPPPLSLPDPYILNPYPQKAGNALVTPLVLRVSMGGADCLPSSNPTIVSHHRSPFKSIPRFSKDTKFSNSGPSVRRVAFRARLKEPIDHHRRGPKGLMFSRGCGVSAIRYRDLGTEQEKEQGGDRLPEKGVGGRKMVDEDRFQQQM